MRPPIAIIGGGPAGLATAIACALKGLPTVVFEKGTWPRDKVCGEGIMPTGVALLHRLGVTRYISTQERFLFRGIRYLTRRGSEVSGTFENDERGWGLRRTTLSRALHRRAQDFGQLIELRDQTRVRPGSIDSGGVHLTINDEKELRTPVVVGADGLHSHVRSFFALQTGKRRYWRWGARQHFAVSPWSDEIEIHIADGVEAYVTPSGDNRVGVAFLWHRDRARLEQAPGISGLFSELKHDFPGLASRITGATPVSEAMAVGPLEHSVGCPVSEGVALVGDASGYVDAITGEGISLALEQAFALAEVLEASSSGTLVSKKCLKPYARRHAQIARNYKRITRMVLGLSQHPQLAERVITALQRTPRLFTHMLSANMGIRSPFALPPVDTARFLIAFLSTQRP